ncbi:hypothetical protein LMCDFJHI_03926 [Aeromonas salmonicida]
MPMVVQLSAFKRTKKMQLMKYSPLALVVASLMSSGGLAAKEWSTVAARATVTDGYLLCRTAGRGTPADLAPA